MSEGSSGPGPARPAGGGDGEPTQIFWDRDPVGGAGPSHQPPADGASPYAPTYVPPTEIRSPYAPGVQPRDAAPPYASAHVQPRPPADTGVPYTPTYVPPRDGEVANPPSDVVRYGPGVPVSQAGATAEQVWRTGRLPEPARRPARLRRLAGAALTVILLAAAGVVLFLRFHHAPFRVTGVAITQQTKTACGVDLTGRINTNGSAGTVSYQWVFRPQLQAPQPLNQSVTAGQHAAYVTVAVEGEGHGSASQTVTLQVLGPDTGTATIHVSVSC
jgi:hypothetical protein